MGLCDRNENGMGDKMKVDKELLQELVGECEGDIIDLKEWGIGEGIYKIMVNEQTDTSRWSIHYSFVFKFEDKFYWTPYSRGATEQQDEQPFEYEDDEIECAEVWPFDVTVTKYSRFKDIEEAL